MLKAGKLVIKKEWLLHIALFFYFNLFYNISLYPVWLSSELEYRLIYCGIVAIVVMYAVVGYRRNVTSYNIFSFLWIMVLIVYTYRNAALANESYKLYFASFLTPLIVLGFLSLCSNWFQCVCKLFYFFSIEHIVCTWFFFFFPSLLEKYIIPLYSPDQVGYSKVALKFNYAIGITANYGYNAIYLSFAVLFFTMLVFNKDNINCSIKKIYILDILAFGGLILTGKRGMLIYTVLTICIVFFIYNRKRLATMLKKLFTVAIPLLVSVLVLYKSVPEFGTTINRILAGLKGKDVAMSNRYVMWNLAKKLYSNNKMFGIGWFGYRYEYNANRIYEKIYESKSLDAHNVFLQLLCETGITGTVFVGGLILIVLILSIKLLCNYSNEIIGFAIALSVAIQIFFISMFFTANPLYDIFALYPYSIAVSIMIFCFRKVNDIKKEK